MLLENGVRQKRRSARNAEEMIRKEILKNKADEENSSDESNFVISHMKWEMSYLNAQPVSPPSLKRSLDKIDNIPKKVTLKKIKPTDGTLPVPVTLSQQNKEHHVTESSKNIAKTNELVRKISQEDIRKKFKKLNQEELEALLLQKIVECITIRSEMGKLREQARASMKSQEATRAKCQKLQKQVEGFDMVLKCICYDKNSNNDKYVQPIKISRSVGLQVNFLSNDSIQKLKQIQMLKPSGDAVNNVGKVAESSIVKANGLSSSISSANTTSNAEPTTQVMNKAVEPTCSLVKRVVAWSQLSNTVEVLPDQKQSTIIDNSTASHVSTRPATLKIQQATDSQPKGMTSDHVDLTDVEDKSEAPVITQIKSGTTSRFSRMLRPVSASATLSNSTNLLNIVPASNQESMNTVMNYNMNTPKLVPVTPRIASEVPTRQPLTTTSNTMRSGTSVSTRNIKTVRVLTQASTTINMQHPAPLPNSPIPESNPAWKLPPPSPSLKITKAASGIVLSWNMTLSDKFAEIVSYQLYAYQEIVETSPSAALWKKVGEVRALPLPMACTFTLTQFAETNNYYFAVRAVDTHSRFGPYSKPGNISL